MERQHVRPARFKRPAVRRARRNRSAAAMVAALLGMIAVPAIALGAANDLLGGVLGDAGQRAGTPPNYQPPLHGSNPHGQGTVGVVDVSPSNAAPLPSEPSATGEEVIVGDSRGEQSGGSYNGRVTLLHVNLLGVINQSIVEIRTQEGQTNTGPTGPLNAALNQICTGSGNTVCLNVLSLNSSTTANGSNNSFSTASADVGAQGVGASVDAASSSGNIAEDGNCQTATGSSNVANAAVTAPGAGAITADVLSSSTTSRTCNDGQRTQTNDSNVVSLNGTGVPVPAAGCGGPNEVADTVVTPVPGVLSLVCNADDVSNGQTAAPYGVREALTAFATLPIVGTVIKVAISGPESHAVAPGAAGGPGAGEPAGAVGGPGDDGGDDTSLAGDAASGDDTLPFTGSNLVLLVLLGVALLTAGLAVSTLSRHRRTAKQL